MRNSPFLPMTQITYRDWTFDCEVEATREAYDAIPAGGVETCECSGCRNFLVQRESVWPEEILKLFDELGVSYKQAAEIYHTAKLPSGLHLYGGWFHFVGVIQNESIGPTTLGRFTVDFLSERALATKAFENHPLVQIEITAEIPWVLAEEPELD